jgi:hypothetical protein
MSYAEKAREWVVDYSAARAKAIEWLGDRYLLARPIKRRSAGQSCGMASGPELDHARRLPGHF